MKLVMLFNGSPPKTAFLERALNSADKIICADGGANLIGKLQITPDIIIGDWDSIDPILKTRLEKAGATLIFKDTQNKTDGEAALDIAIGFKPSEIIILGAFGRHDHEHANIALLEKYLDVDIRLADEGKEVFLVGGKRSRKITGNIGDIVSLLPLSEEVKGIELTGLKWVPKERTLLRHESTGVSNEMTAKEAEVRVSEGLLKVVHWEEAE